MNEQPVFVHDEPVDIGHGVTMSIARVDGEPFAITETHSAPSGERCRGWVLFDNAAARRITADAATKWTVESLDTLTLSPSILCRACGHHGYIRGGRWVAA